MRLSLHVLTDLSLSLIHISTAADGSGVTDSCIIRVVNPVTGIEVVPDSLRLFVGDSQKLGVNVYPDNATIKDRCV